MREVETRFSSPVLSVCMFYLHCKWHATECTHAPCYIDSR
uniref:Uncharacterized protein n=1 Tax=Anguilla anguilla TaxID=7936 RepID=A0A0E9S1I6_ANGAN